MIIVILNPSICIKQIKNNKGDLQAFLEHKKLSARDNSRTPFQWNDSTNAGFTTGTPWLKCKPEL